VRRERQRQRQQQQAPRRRCHGHTTGSELCWFVPADRSTDRCTKKWR
jgi:hypothetical protein